MFPKDHKI